MSPHTLIGKIKLKNKASIAASLQHRSICDVYYQELNIMNSWYYVKLNEHNIANTHLPIQKLIMFLNQFHYQLIIIRNKGHACMDIYQFTFSEIFW